MSMNPLPRIRTNVPKSELTWNEHFYICLGKVVWILATLILFGIIIMVKMTMHVLGGFGDIIVTLFISIGAVYLIVALPVSIIYAFVMRKRYAKK
ncbi:MAG TPA: hypothetical protein O0X27_03905 [Methanocorpusculum sp.]|nr:hypothetical protein [Methanocorpusculum sp.]